ncbi:CDP-glucose 4,6-dehydratase [Flavobacteriaceae bacterium]|nr:CDP-glucose 4,6-dehydratase [Flavobacteriaceae bacterium]
MELIRENFFNKKVLISGHTGFKGSWLTFLLDQLGAYTKGYSLKPNTLPSLYSLLKFSNKHESIISDVRDSKRFRKEIENFKPNYIFHLAAQPLVIESYLNPRDTFEINFNGSLNLLETLRLIDLDCTLIIVTTDKVYHNEELNLPFKEEDKLGGNDPYSASKAALEILINSYCKSFFNESNIKIASVRAGNVIGGGDWSTNRLIPDIVRSIFENKKLIIRNPKSTRPWQHVLDPLNGYLKLAISLNKNKKKFQGSWNFGPEIGDDKSVEELIEITKSLGFELEVNFEINYIQKEAKYLSLDIEKAKKDLKWSPRWNSKEALNQTLLWYKGYYNGTNPNSLIINEIEKYYNQ